MATIEKNTYKESAPPNWSTLTQLETTLATLLQEETRRAHACKDLLKVRRLLGEALSPREYQGISRWGLKESKLGRPAMYFSPEDQLSLAEAYFKHRTSAREAIKRISKSVTSSVLEKLKKELELEKQNS